MRHHQRTDATPHGARHGVSILRGAALALPLAALVAAAPLPVQAAKYVEGRKFSAAGWEGEVFRNPKNGRMRCEMTDNYGDGAFVRLIWGENGFSMAFHKKGWGLDKGKTRAFVRVDNRWSDHVNMQVRPQMAVLSFGFRDEPINAVRDGVKIYLDIDGDSTSWTLNGTNAAIGVLYDCYKTAIAK